ncbi:MAG: hypothetical protein ISR96_06855 [Nitrospira sp.]|nr:hypothetical protein [Nitrospira sp.]
MRRKYGIILALILITCPLLAYGADIVTIQSVSIKPYNDALEGFEKACDCSTKSYRLSEVEDIGLDKIISREKPEVVAAIGVDALKKAREIKDIPVIYFMVPNPSRLIAGSSNITGVSMNMSPAKQLVSIKLALPDLMSVGVVYDPERTGPFVAKAARAAEAQGIKLVTRKVSDSREVPFALKSLKGEVEAIWMLPDLTVLRAEILEFMFMYAAENRMPVIAFSEKYVKSGAMMSIDISPSDIGVQAGEMAARVLAGVRVRDLPGLEARKAEITVNYRVATRLNWNINEKEFNTAKTVNAVQ